MTQISEPYHPSLIAQAVAALTHLDESDSPVVQSSIFLERFSHSNWRVWRQAADWRVQNGGMLYGNFEVKKSGTNKLTSQGFIRPDAPVERKAWAQAKETELAYLVESTRLIDEPLNRWIAAFVDVAPLKFVSKCIEFRRSTVAPEIELIARDLRVLIAPAVPDLSTGWELSLQYRNESLALFPEASMNEAQAMSHLIESAGLRCRQPINTLDE